MWNVALALLMFDLLDIHGVRHSHSEIAGQTAVLLFVNPTCPLSARAVPELNRLYNDFSPRGMKFFAVYAETVRETPLAFTSLLDPAQTLARQTGATATPEAIVLSAKGAVLYRGRIDDRSIEAGKTRPQPTRADLRIALEEIAAGKPVSVPETKPVGCTLFLPRTNKSGRVTFARQIGPLLYKHCANCHRPGQVAPFPLLSYADAAPRAAIIAAVTANHTMPPWRASAGHLKLVGEEKLTPREIGLFQQWFNEGAPEGSPPIAPPQFRDGWQLGEPDLVLKMPQPFSIAADGPDLYQCFVVPLNLKENRYVRAIEFSPGSRRVVHHALFFTDASGTARKRAAASGGQGYPCFGVPGFLPTSSLGGWSPGNSPRPFPEGTGAPIGRGSDLVMQIHYHATGTPESDQSALAIYFSKGPPTRKLMDVALGSRLIDIPAGDAAYHVRDHFELPVDVWATGIIPHAHYICKEMHGVAILPDGRRVTLLDITDWDFNWQRQYRYETPVLLPEGTRLEMDFVYDNSAANPRNPNVPPQRTLWGPDSTDEMAGLHVQVIPVHNEDVRELGQALWGKIMRSVGGRF
jgi:hypothetical protein